MGKRKKIEKKVAEIILESPKDVTVGGSTYIVAPPSTATLIMVSGLVAELPEMDTDVENIFSETLRVAKDCEVIGEIAAVLIRGAKKTKAEKRNPIIAYFKRDALKEKLLDLSPSDLNTIIIDLIKGMEIADFFGLTTSLSEINMTKPTKEVVNETIASGL